MAVKLILNFVLKGKKKIKIINIHSCCTIKVYGIHLPSILVHVLS